MRRSLAILLLAGALVLPPAGSVRAALTVDPHAEVAAALFSASATQAAIERADDAKLRAQQSQIAALSLKVKAGETAARAQLVAAQQSFVAQLAEKDRAYAQAIEVFRGAVTDIAATPQGAAALARFNSGDAAGALAVLDKLQAADEAARQRATDVQKAAGERRIAELAMDARDRGKIDTASVIGRYEAVTRLDPGEFRDWARLDRLYEDAGRTSDAHRAAEMAVKTAADDEDRTLAEDELGDVLVTEGDLAKARAAYEADLAIYRRLSAADPANPAYLREVSVSLGSIGDVSQAQGDLAGALKAFEESLAIRRALAAADAARAPTTGPLDAGGVLVRRSLASALDKVGGVLLAQRDLAGALKAYLEALGIRNQLLPASPHLNDVDLEHDAALSMFEIGDLMVIAQRPANALEAYGNALKLSHNLIALDATKTEYQQNLASSLHRIGQVKASQGDTAGALAADKESLGIIRGLAAHDPTSAALQRDLTATLWDMASLAGSGVTWTDVVSQLQAMNAKGMLREADRPLLAAAQAHAAGK